MPKFLLILRSDPRLHQRRDAAARQAALLAFETWAGRLLAERRFVDGKKLGDDDRDGRVLHGSGGSVRVAAGPFGSGADVVRGFSVIEADDYEHAVALCESHPDLAAGGTLEVRQLD